MTPFLFNFLFPPLKDSGIPRSRYRKYYTRKTSRNYGALRRIARTALATGLPVRPEDFLPFCSIERAISLLDGLLRRGEAIVVSPGHRAKGTFPGRQSVFRAANDQAEARTR